MKHYINKQNEIFAYALDGSQDHLITSDMKPISLEEIEAINKAKQAELEATTEYKVQEALSTLNGSDWKVIRELERKFLADTELNKKREELRAAIK